MVLEKNTNIQIKKIHLEQSGYIKKAAYTQFFPSLAFTGTYIRMNKKFQLFEEDLNIPVLPADFYDPSTGTINTALLNNPEMMPLAYVIDPQTGYPLMDVNGNPVFHQYAFLPADQLTFGQKNNYMLNLGLIQPIYTGGKIRQMYKMSQTLEEMAKSSISLEEEKELTEMEELYWTLITLNEKYKLAVQYKKLLENLISDIQNYKSEGIVLNNDLLKARIKLNEADLNIFKITNGIQLTKKALCHKIGFPYDQYFEPADTIIPAEIFQADPEKLKHSALKNREDLKMLDHTVRMTESGIKIMRSRFQPDIGFTANYMYMNPNPFNGFSESFGGDYNLGIALNVPIFHWGERQQTLAIAQCENKVARLMLEDSHKLIVLQIEQAVNQLNEAYKELEMSKLSLQQTEENLRIMTDAFSEGMCRSSELLEAQVLWQEAYSKYIDAKAAYHKQVVNIKNVGSIHE